jgi:uncharacterized membrane protein YedE/YeeE
MQILASLLCGLIFGAGLLISGMTQTGKVLGFLDVLGRWDPTLAFVMGGALAVTVAGFALARRRVRPLFAERHDWPGNRRIDGALIGGAALFGVGWGLVGLCPGPALENLATFSPGVAMFVLAMVAGSIAYDRWRAHVLTRPASASTDG